MSLLDKIRALFGGTGVTEETREALEKAASTDELLGQLDTLVTRNEMKCAELTNEIEKLELIEKDIADKVRAGSLAGLNKSTALHRIQRIRKQKENYHFRLKIYHKNINMQMNLIGKIQEMEAMEMAGLEESKIDEILLKAEERTEQYERLTTAGKVLDEMRGRVSVAEERELAELEAEILAAAPTPVVESVPETARHKAVEREEAEPEATEPETVEAEAAAPERPSLEEMLETEQPPPLPKAPERHVELN